MPLPLSQLIYSRFHETPSPRRVIALHRYNQFLEATKDVGVAINPDGVVIGLQASKGVYLGRGVVGYTWFVGPLDQPSPVHFGDAMQEIERFLWDEVDRQAPGKAALPFLVGDEQGAIMALAMAGATPDLLSGVVAIDALLPVVPGWEPPLAPLDGLPVLLVNPQVPPAAKPGSEPRHAVLYRDALRATLTDWGATVTVVNGDPGQAGEIPTDRIAAWIAEQPVRMRAVGGAGGAGRVDRNQPPDGSSARHGLQTGEERVTATTSAEESTERRERLAQLMVLVLPAFGRWASAIRDFETPYGKAGIRQLEVLYMLRHNLLDPTKPTATALADRFQIQRSVVTRILTKLETGGYIVRIPDPRDGRAWQITITENGRLLSDYVEARYFEEMATALGVIDERDASCLEHSLDLLIRVAANLGLGETNERINDLRGPSRTTR